MTISQKYRSYSQIIQTRNSLPSEVSQLSVSAYYSILFSTLIPCKKKKDKKKERPKPATNTDAKLWVNIIFKSLCTKLTLLQLQSDSIWAAGHEWQDVPDVGKGAIMFKVVNDKSGFCLKSCRTQRIKYSLRSFLIIDWHKKQSKVFFKRWYTHFKLNVKQKLWAV